MASQEWLSAGRATPQRINRLTGDTPRDPSWDRQTRAGCAICSLAPGHAGSATNTGWRGYSAAIACMTCILEAGIPRQARVLLLRVRQTGRV